MAHVDDSSVSPAVSPRGYNKRWPEATDLPSSRPSPARETDAGPKTAARHRPPLSAGSLGGFDTSRKQTTRIQRHDSLYTTAQVSGCQRFLLSNFKYFLTLFSKFFSSFPHGTCSLSVSRRYLALEEIYLPFRVAIPNNSTL